MRNPNKDTLELLITSFISRLEKIENAPLEKVEQKVINTCKYELTILKARFTDATVKDYATQYRKAIKEHYGGMKKVPTAKRKKQLLIKRLCCGQKRGHNGYLKLGRNLTYELNRNYAEKVRVARVKSNKVELSEFVINEAIKEATKLISNKRMFIKNAIGVCLLTGRRMIEVIRTGNFHAVNEFTILFSGQAKVRNKTGSKVQYEIPTLYNAFEICEAIAKIRQHISEKTNHNEKDNRQLTQSVAVSSSGHVKTTFKAIDKLISAKTGKRITVKDLRKLYASILWSRDTDKENEAEFLTHVLGHGLGSNSEQSTYQAYNIFRIVH